MAKQPMDPYKAIARFYDDITSERSDIDFVANLIAKYHPKAQTVLDLGCGTGTTLCYLSKIFEVTGLDQSSAMLKIAKSKMLHGKFLQGDMRSFALTERFDVIACLLDTINHLLSFSEWKQVFKNAHKHLNPGGVFIFDVNTEAKYHHFMQASPFVEDDSESILIFEVTKASKNIFALHSKVFEKQRSGLYKFSESCVSERTFPMPQIRSNLEKRFQAVYMKDIERSRVTSESQMVYFICKKRR
ncbi:class I SAM-dependent methyltransferase [Oligoflexia bacterium]|nr:class I SAM-dependent methyltransferase [Oligoflexia bacterium]